MTTAAVIRAEARQRFRDAVLDAAYRTTLADGWGSVRMGALAAQVGVSRQTLHHQFGTKDALGEALVLREAERLLAQVLAVLEAGSDDPVDAMRAGAVLAMELLTEHPLRAATLASGDSLLPQLTSRSGPLLERANASLSTWLLGQGLGGDPTYMRDLVDAVVRLIISYSVTPRDSPRATGERVARLFAAGLASGHGLPKRALSG